MRTLRVALAATVVVLVTAACGDTDEPERTVTSYDALAAVLNEPRTTAFDQQADEFFDLTCDALRNGASLTDVGMVLYNTGVTVEQAGRSVIIAVGERCPEMLTDENIE